MDKPNAPLLKRLAPALRRMDRLRLHFFSALVMLIVWDVAEAGSRSYPRGLALGLSLLVSPVYAWLATAAFWLGWRNSRHTYSPAYIASSAGATVLAGHLAFGATGHLGLMAGAVAALSFVLGLRGSLANSSARLYRRE